MSGTITRSSTGVTFGVGGACGGGITGTGGFGGGVGFGVRATLRVGAWGFASDDPTGRCFGGGGEVYCQGNSGPGDRAGGVAFLTVSRLTPFGDAPAGYVRLERVSGFFLAGLFGLADPAGLGGSETGGLLRLCRGG